MRLITRCPACGTLFKVVPDQLRISEGWVRCGHCAEVFDATAHLHDPDAQPVAPELTALPLASHDAPPGEGVPAPAVDPSYGTAASSSDEVLDAANDVAAAQTDPSAPAFTPWRPESHAQPSSDPQTFTAGPSPAADPAPLQADPGWRPQAVPAQVSTDFESTLHRAGTDDDAEQPRSSEPVQDADADGVAPDGTTMAPVDAEPIEAEPADRLVGDAWTPPGPAEPSPVPPSSEQVHDEVHDQVHDERNDDAHDAATAAPTFVRQAERREFWRRPAMRATLLVLLVVALVGFVVQVAYMERDRIAAHVPAARPALAAMCQVLRCEVSALRKIEAVVVDGSSFTRLRSDAYRLGIVLKNTSSTDIAMPSVELTLTSLQGQTVLRRVLSPSDMGASATLGAGAEWVGDLPLVLDTAEVAARVAGYTVLPFYP